MLTRRIVRAGLLGSALAVLTLAGHTAGAGAVDALGVGIVAVLSIALAAALSSRALRLPVLLAVLLAGQGFLHLVVSLSAAHPHMSSASGSPLSSTGAMVSAHVLAAVVAAVLITQADGLAARWQAFLAAVIGTTPLRSGPIGQAVTEPTGEGHDPTVTLVLLLHGVVRRGPPASVVLA